MHQTKKGNQYFFGMKAHIGVDDESGLVHRVVGTAANVADVTQVDQLLHGEEHVVCANAGYTGGELFRLETADLQLDGHQAVEAAMEEQQVEGEVPATDLQRVFGADEAEVAAQLDEKVLEPRQQALMQVGLGLP